jgi:hypothetical protein
MVMMVSFASAVSLPGDRPRPRQRTVNGGPKTQLAAEFYDGGVLQVRLLGGVAAERDGEQLSLPPPVGRLLALLALRPGAHDRETVAATLWPSAAGPAARANLRTAVWALRKAVGDDALVTSRRGRAASEPSPSTGRRPRRAAAVTCRIKLRYAARCCPGRRGLGRGGPAAAASRGAGDAIVQPRPPSATVTRAAQRAGRLRCEL